MPTYDHVVVVAAAAYLVGSALLAGFLVIKGVLDVLGRRADLAIDAFIMRVGPEGWGSIVVFPIVTNVGSSMLVAGSVAVASAWRHGDVPWWGYATAFAGLLIAVGVPVWASREIKDPDRVAVSVMIHTLSEDFSESVKSSALTAISRQKSELEAQIVKVHGRTYKTYVATFTIGAVWFAVLATMNGGWKSWAIVGGYGALAVVGLLARGPARRRSLRRMVQALDGYRARVQQMRAPSSVDAPHHRHGGWAVIAAFVVGAILPRALGRGRRP